ncbi:hypothetical protein BT96DRAFT_316135 [Gymnopus androsaceus JB14]|uniref:Uncharacterized protein n=1 Tax=Gymnopus androsaceus JB14 TaxID=1447944 RepID=A0A6A4I4S1_9AGAR|nr:hypothetical protein BT96DRAFT_316135 [Gymnopus androsaceus JB14]
MVGIFRLGSRGRPKSRCNSPIFRLTWVCSFGSNSFSPNLRSAPPLTFVWKDLTRLMVHLIPPRGKFSLGQELLHLCVLKYAWSWRDDDNVPDATVLGVLDAFAGQASRWKSLNLTVGDGDLLNLFCSSKLPIGIDLKLLKAARFDIATTLNPVILEKNWHYSESCFPIARSCVH